MIAWDRASGAGDRPEDTVVLSMVRDLFEAVDPMPADLPERVRFALALRALEAEMAHFADAADEAALVARGTEESRTVTFDSDSLTIMIRVDSNPDGTARIDGWLAPPKPHEVEMRMTDCSLTVMADELGRFVFYSVPRGAARLVVHRSAESGIGERSAPSLASKLVITPALTLLSDQWTRQSSAREPRTAGGCKRLTTAIPLMACGGCVPAWRNSAGAGRTAGPSAACRSHIARWPPDCS